MAIINNGTYQKSVHLRYLAPIKDALRKFCTKKLKKNDPIFGKYKKKFIVQRLIYHFTTLNRHNGIFLLQFGLFSRDFSTQFVE